MEMMRLLLLLAAATRAKELSFGRDGVELFRRVFDKDALERLRRAWDAVEANETMVQSEVLEEGCVKAVARTTAAPTRAIAWSPPRGWIGRSPATREGPCAGTSRSSTVSGGSWVIRAPAQPTSRTKRAALEVERARSSSEIGRPCGSQRSTRPLRKTTPSILMTSASTASLEDHIKRLSGKTIPQRAATYWC